MATVRTEQLKWVTLLRVLLVTFLLGATVFVNLRDDHDPHVRFYGFLYYLCTAIYILSFFYTAALRVLRKDKYLLVLTYAQLTGDVIFAGAIVLVTGGTDSVFTFFFSLVIIAGAILRFRTGAVFLAMLSTVLMVVMGLIEEGVLPLADAINQVRLGFLPTPIRETVDDFSLFNPTAFNVSLNTVAFFAVAFLASTLAEQVRRSYEVVREQKERLVELRALYFNVVNSLPTGLATINLDGQVTYFNQSAERITGHSRDVVTGTDVTKYFRDLRFVMANPHKLASVSREESIIVVNRRRVYLGWSLSVLRDASDQMIGHTFLFQDITRIKELERMVRRHEKMAAVGELASAIAHEIRNPLTAISGSIQLLSGNVSMDEDDQRLLKIVLRETDQLNDWINDFLSYSKRQPMELETVNWDSIIDEQLAMFRQDESVRDIVIEKESVGATYVKGDKVSLRQVVWNLLKNAVEASPAGGRIGITVAHSSNGMADLQISDEGCGIPEEELDAIFRPFFTTKERGTGLGLAIVHRIVDEHEGQITVKSESGKGSTFCVRFPLSTSGAQEIEELHV